MTGSRNVGCGFGSRKTGHQNVWKDRNRNFGHKKRLSDGSVENDNKKGGSVATSQSMIAKQGDYKCGDKYSAQYPWVLRWSLEKKRVNLRIARGPFGAIISMKIEIIPAALKARLHRRYLQRFQIARVN